MNKLVIVGNGFDLAHGMKTSYDSFLEYVFLVEKQKIIVELESKQHNNRGFKYYCNFFSIWFEGETIKNISDEFKNIHNINDLNNYIKELSKKISVYDHLNNKNIIFTDTRIHYNNLIYERYLRIKNAKWTDLEKIYYEILLETKPREVEKLNEDFENLKTKLEEYLGSIPLPKEKEVYKNVLLNNNKGSDKRIATTKIINFNYTNTLEIYNLNNYGIEVINIHGQIGDKNNPPIFGYGDEIDENYKERENRNNREYLINSKSVRYLQTENYKKITDFLYKSINGFKVYVIGHSLGLSDRTLLNTIFEHLNCKSIRMFYYIDEETKQDNFLDLSINATRNFKNKPNMREVLVDRTNSTSIDNYIEIIN